MREIAPPGQLNRWVAIRYWATGSQIQVGESVTQEFANLSTRAQNLHDVTLR